MAGNRCHQVFGGRRRDMYGALHADLLPSHVFQATRWHRRKVRLVEGSLIVDVLWLLLLLMQMRVDW